MNTWKNGDSGAVVKKNIDDNFDTLDARINQITKIYVEDFTTSDWLSGVIPIEYSKYQKSNPCVELYIKNENGYSVICGGYEIKDYGIELQSDIPYKGKVVIR